MMRLKIGGTAVRSLIPNRSGVEFTTTGRVCTWLGVLFAGAGLLLPPVVRAQGFGAQAPVTRKARIIATTDGEVDDRDSMTRLLMMANEWEIEGLVYASSGSHWLGREWAGVEWIQGKISSYARDYPNLRNHAEGYPTPEELMSKVFVGNIHNTAETDRLTPGAERIVEVLLDDKPGPVYLQAWGGPSTIAAALKVIQKQHPDQIDKVNQKAVLYLISDQDGTFREYIEPNWPKLQILLCNAFGSFAYGARNNPQPYRALFERPWMEGYITSGRGALAGSYEGEKGAFRSEGDSPSFFYSVDVGLRSLEDPGYGGWGGRFSREKPNQTNVWVSAPDDGNNSKAIYRWATALQFDWAARAAWAVTPSYRDANHPPIVVLEGSPNRQVRRGETVEFDLSASGDPDGDQLRFSWWQYKDAGTYKGKVSIANSDRAIASVRVPDDAAPGDTIHLIAEVTDTGKLPLIRYARIILTVQAGPTAE
jgi:hypothetical protein